MKGLRLLGLVTLFGGLVACGSRPHSSASAEGVPVIDVEAAMKDLQPALKLSDFGMDVHYIPLETNDSCLVSGGSGVALADTCLVVSSHYGLSPKIYSFERKTGHFIAEVGHRGEDPEGYTSALHFYNEENGLFYFVRQPDKLQKYDSHGRYRGCALVPVQPELPVSFVFVDSLVVGYHGTRSVKAAFGDRLFSIFTEDGILIDTIPQVSLGPMYDGEEIKASSIFSLFGFDLRCMIYKDDKVGLSLSGPSSLWKCGENVRLKNGLNDTVYTWQSGKGVRPTFIFKYGQWQLTEESWQRGDSRSKLLVIGLCETVSKLYFLVLSEPFETLRESTKALFSQGGKAFQSYYGKIYHGIYDKQTGVTRMAPFSAKIQDDLIDFLPIKMDNNSQKEFVGLIEANDVVVWLKKHPEAKDNPKLAPLLKVQEEDNPVVVIVSDK